jgi:pimeloyl-ACP methyl ester carboxylesterase
MDLPDGRELAWLETGKARGTPVFVFHGTPGSRLQVSFYDETIAGSGVRCIAPDRPGYGHSTFHRGRSLIDWAADVAALADHLKIDRFGVVGISGGGPHAAVCAAHLGDRVSSTAIVSGVGPMGDAELSASMEGMNRGIGALAAHMSFVLVPILQAQVFVMRHWPERALSATRRQMAAPDLAVLERPDVRAVFVEDARRASATTAQATVQDFTLFVREWGFRLQDIAVPVHVWHGDADKNVPYAQGEFVARRIPGAEFHPCPGEGHLLVIDHLSEILQTVASAA